ncbi:MAG: hypothetical protein NTY35_09745 [Planctomycetota bacterium]|nr:hypothetical protein [Planctomycetota bacterium]
MKSSILDRRAQARLLRVLRACTPRRPRRVLLEEAEIELWRLYRREQAELLRQAGDLRLAPARTEARSAWRAALRDWRRRAAECAGLCAHDGYPLAPRLAACLAHPAHGWPAAAALHSDAARLGALPT